MFKVMFEDANYMRHDIAICDAIDGAWYAFKDYLKDLGIEPPYYRTWTNENNELMIDFGSHSSFGVVIQMFDFS